jgi:hypothetical protein
VQDLRTREVGAVARYWVEHAQGGAGLRHLAFLDVPSTAEDDEAAARPLVENRASVPVR